MLEVFVVNPASVCHLSATHISSNPTRVLDVTMAMQEDFTHLADVSLQEPAGNSYLSAKKVAAERIERFLEGQAFFSGLQHSYLVSGDLMEGSY